MSRMRIRIIGVRRFGLGLEGDESEGGGLEVLSQVWTVGVLR